MDTSREKRISLPLLALIAATRGMIGFGAGLLLADKFERKLRRNLGWTLFSVGVASTVPIAARVFGRER